MFNRLRRLNPFRESLQKTRESVFTQVTRLFTQTVIDDALWDELETLLIRADVGAGITANVIQHLQTRVERTGMTQAHDLEAALREELLALLGGDESTALVRVSPRTVILVVGVNGVGKTTSIAKLGRYLQQTERRRIIIAAGDTFRAAAVEQLAIWGERIGVPVVRKPDNTDPSAVVFDAMDQAATLGLDTVIVDTAGRLHTKLNLMEELKKISRVAGKALPGAPHEVLLVLDATSGRNALEQARVFGDVVNVTGVILTKLDGTAKGGVAFGVRSELKVPIKFVGTGEKLENFAPFDPRSFVDALFQAE